MTDWHEEEARRILIQMQVYLRGAHETNNESARGLLSTALRTAENRGIERAAGYMEGESAEWRRRAEAETSDEPCVLYHRLANVLNNAAPKLRALKSGE